MGLGIFYLENAYKDVAHYSPPANSKGLINANCPGITWRTTWDLSQTGPLSTDFNFTYLDDAIAASDGANKISSFQLLANNQSASGVTSPAWFFDQPGAVKFTSSDGSTFQVPWDPVFQSFWKTYHSTMSKRYKSHSLLKYVVIAGCGRLSESFFLKSSTDRANADLLALQFGYPDAPTAWLAGTQKLIDIYNKAWAPIPVVLVTGQPFPPGTTTFDPLQLAFDYGQARHPGLFGARCDGLTSISPQPSDPCATIIQQFAGTGTGNSQATGYQSHNSQDTLVKFTNQMNLGISYGARFLELWNSDCDKGLTDPGFAAAMAAANAALIAQ